MKFYIILGSIAVVTAAWLVMADIDTKDSLPVTTETLVDGIAAGSIDGQTVVSGSAPTEVNTAVAANNRDGASYGDSLEAESVDAGAGELVYVGDPDGNLERSGFQFQLNVPQGSTITEAYMTIFVVELNGTSGNVTLGFYDVDTAPVFNAADGHNLEAHSTTSATTVAWTSPPFTASNSFTTPDISSLVQIVVDRAGWAANNYIGILMLPDSWSMGSEIGIYSHNEGTANVATLQVFYN